MRTSLTTLLVAFFSVAYLTPSTNAQNAGNPIAALTPPAPASGGVDSQATGAGRIVRDPTTGRMFYQQWITETVPATRWESKQITTTVYETQWVNQVVPTTQTVYQPQTQNVLQPVWKGAWNPFRQPTLAYESKPVTNWVPATVTTSQVIPRQQVVPRQQTITVPQPVTETKTQQRLVQTEIHQPSFQPGASGLSQPVMTARQPPALINIPLLARGPMTYAPQYRGYQPIAPAGNVPPAANASGTVYPSNAWVACNNRPATTPVYPANPNQSTLVQSSLRPVTRLGQTVFPQAYNAPMRTAASQGGTWNSMQTGMTPTVLR